MQYRVLVNCSTLIKGGALQVAVAFILNALRDPYTAGWQYLISSGVAQELEGFGVDLSDSCFSIIERSPARNSDQRKRVLEIEARMRPDLVFTLFGPAYVRFKAKHLCGVADPWVTHSTTLAFSMLKSWQHSFKTLATMGWKALWWLQADFWWTEAAVAKDGLVSRLRCREDHVYIIPNTAGPQFEKARASAKPPAGGKIRILCLAAYYPHKNLEIIPDVLKELQDMRPDLNFELTVTLPPELSESQKIVDRAEQLGVGDKLKNLGRVPVSEAPALYAQSHICFLPSVLEVFSAVYPESLSTGVPLVTTDLRFATDVCKDAAVYFEPTNAKSAAKQIIRLAEDRDFWQEKSDLGRQIYKALPDSGQQWGLQKEVIARVAVL